MNTEVDINHSDEKIQQLWQDAEKKFNKKIWSIFFINNRSAFAEVETDKRFYVDTGAEVSEEDLLKV